MKRRDVSGQRFGYLTALEFAYSANGNTYWKCVCDCGKEKNVRLSHLLSGNAKSCGCMHRLYKHHQTETRLYHIWCTMKARCVRKSCAKYGSYGGRGIEICEDWLQFEPFMKWSIENGYKDDLSIDRIDVNGNYEPSNCRWATAKQQANNKRDSTRIRIDGKLKTLSEWCEEYGLSYGLVYRRIRKGWDAKDALTIGVGIVQKKGCRGYAQWKAQQEYEANT